MTNQEAIKILQTMLTVNQKEVEAVGTAIKALKEADRDCGGCKYNIPGYILAPCETCIRCGVDNYVPEEGEECDG